ncbi:hypothetical protein NDU88_001819 [Pleurodeles waltl]|uniref:Uncharacterized protein n=1 Tax=Pleurodeles waltl TaxID=8319 RepID=A0AAV7RDX1_PLEWA|nr:hypothetical protein NDU88_001819 [Pleurodeles waltl]
MLWKLVENVKYEDIYEVSGPWGRGHFKRGAHGTSPDMAPKNGLVNEGHFERGATITSPDRGREMRTERLGDTLSEGNPALHRTRAERCGQRWWGTL